MIAFFMSARYEKALGMCGRHQVLGCSEYVPPKMELPWCPVVKISFSKARGASLIPGWGGSPKPKNQNMKQKKYHNEFNKDFKNGPQKKKKKKKNF